MIKKTLPISEFFASTTTIYGMSEFQTDSEFSFSFEPDRWLKLVDFYMEDAQNWNIIQELKRQLIRDGSFKEPIKIDVFSDEDLEGSESGSVIFYVCNGTHRSAAYYLAWKEFPQYFTEVEFVFESERGEIYTCCGEKEDSHKFIETEISLPPSEVVDADELMDIAMYSAPINDGWWETSIASFSSGTGKLLVDWMICESKPESYSVKDVEKLLSKRILSKAPKFDISVESYLLDEEFERVVRL